MIDRRVFLVAIAIPRAGNTQPAKKVWRIGWLGNLRLAGSPVIAAMRAEFHTGMREAGYMEIADY